MMRKTLFILAIIFVALLNVASAANHPAHIAAMVYGPPVSVMEQRQPVRTFHYMTPFEREVRARSVFGYHVLRLVVVTADAWVSPREGKVYVSKGEGRWHRAGAWRRVQ
jgi:hypothetical protein